MQLKWKVPIVTQSVHLFLLSNNQTPNLISEKYLAVHKVANISSINGSRYASLLCYLPKYNKNWKQLLSYQLQVLALDTKLSWEKLQLSKISAI